MAARKPRTAPRGFAALTPAERRELGRRGGRHAQTSGNGHRFTAETARAAGQIAHAHGTAHRFDAVSGAIAGRLSREPLPNPRVPHGDLLDRLFVGGLSAVDLVLCVRDLLALGESLSTLHELRPATEPVVLTRADRQTLASHDVPEVVYWFLGVPAPSTRAPGKRRTAAAAAKRAREE